MKMLATATLLITSILMPNAASAQQNVEQMNVLGDFACFYDISVYTRMLETEYKEKPLFIANTAFPMASGLSGEPSYMIGILVTYVNQDTGTFSNVIVFEDGSGCELGVGENFVPAS